MKRTMLYALSCILTFAVGYGMYERYSHTRATESVQLPKPTGSFDIGTITYHLIDTQRHERHSQNPNDYRELMLQVWYPARVTAPRQAHDEEKTLYIPSVELESVIWTRCELTRLTMHRFLQAIIRLLSFLLVGAQR